MGKIFSPVGIRKVDFCEDLQSVCSFDEKSSIFEEMGVKLLKGRELWDLVSLCNYNEIRIIIVVREKKKERKTSHTSSLENPGLKKVKKMPSNFSFSGSINQTNCIPYRAYHLPNFS